MFASNKSAAPSGKLFVEDVFSTWLYTGNGSTQTITNGIDLAGKGGLVWIKSRSNAVTHNLQDTARGANIIISSNSTAAQYDGGPAGVNWAFNSNGFSQNNAFTDFNASGVTYASWTFREAPKFFDVVTYTGTGANRNIAHNLGSVPGMIIVKRTNTTSNWQVYHRGLSSAANSIQLNLTSAQAAASTVWNSTAPTATEFTVGTDATVNASGGTYVAYLYAHDATSDGVIQCGTFTSDASNVVANVTLGWEPQWVMVKRTDSTGNWVIYDNMRGMPITGYASTLNPNLTNAEALDVTLEPNATGFSSTYFSAPSATYVYVAIRRPMKIPTLGTSVFMPIVRAGTGAADTVTSVGFPPDALMTRSRNNGTGIAAFGNMTIWDRLRGVRTGDSKYMFTNYTQEERSISNAVLTLNMNGYSLGTDGSIGTSNYSSSENYINYSFRRAPSFFDEVCYTGTGANLTLNHNLGVAPELIIIKRRNSTGNWVTGTQFTPTTGSFGWLNVSDGFFRNFTYAAIGWFASQPTSSTFSVLTDPAVNTSGGTYIAYLFASAPGVSKVGSYTGNGSSQTINCAFAAGARFVLIKRTDSTGDWYVWDTARGIVAGNDPYIALNTDVVEVTSNDTIDPASTGFIVNQVAATNVNVNAATYIFLAIA